MSDLNEKNEKKEKKEKKDEIISSENLFICLTEESRKSNIESKEVTTNKKLNEEISKVKVGFDDFDDEENQKVENTKEEKIVDNLNLNISKKKNVVEKETTNKDKTSSKLKKIIPFLILGTLVFVLLIVLIFLFGGNKTEPIKVEPIAVESSDSVDNSKKTINNDYKYNTEKKNTVQEPVRNSTDDKYNTESTNNKDDKYNVDKNPFLDADELKAKKENYEKSVLKEEYEKTTDNTEFIPLKKIEDSNKIPDSQSDKPQVSDNSNTTKVTVAQQQDEELERNKKLQDRLLMLEAEKKQKDEEKRIQELKQQENNSTDKIITFKAKKENSTAINIFMINGNNAFLGSELYVENTIKINKKPIIANFNGKENKYLNIAGTNNYVSASQIEDNYLINLE